MFVSPPSLLASLISTKVLNNCLLISYVIVKIKSWNLASPFHRVKIHDHGPQNSLMFNNFKQKLEPTKNIFVLSMNTRWIFIASHYERFIVFSLCPLTEASSYALILSAFKPKWPQLNKSGSKAPMHYAFKHNWWTKAGKRNKTG